MDAIIVTPRQVAFHSPICRSLQQLSFFFDYAHLILRCVTRPGLKKCTTKRLHIRNNRASQIATARRSQSGTRRVRGFIRPKITFTFPKRRRPAQTQFCMYIHIFFIIYIFYDAFLHRCDTASQKESLASNTVRMHSGFCAASFVVVVERDRHADHAALGAV